MGESQSPLLSPVWWGRVKLWSGTNGLITYVAFEHKYRGERDRRNVRTVYESIISMASIGGDTGPYSV